MNYNIPRELQYPALPCVNMSFFESVLCRTVGFVNSRQVAPIGQQSAGRRVLVGCDTPRGSRSRPLRTPVRKREHAVKTCMMPMQQAATRPDLDHMTPHDLYV